MLASEVIDRAYDTWLYPAGVDRPAYDVLTSDLDADPADKVIALSGRVQNIPRDSVLEIGSELILTESVTGSSVTANERGYLETAVSAHVIGDRVLVNPRYTRKQIFDALVSMIQGLYTLGLYRRSTSTIMVPASRAAISLPAGAKKVLGVVLLDNEGAYLPRLRQGWDYEVYYDASPPRIQFNTTSFNPQVTVAMDFTVPTVESDALDVPDGLQAHLPMAVAGYLLQGKEVPRVQIEEIRRLLASQGIQVGQALSLGQAMLRAFENTYAVRERRRLREQDPVRFAWSR